MPRGSNDKKVKCEQRYRGVYQRCSGPASVRCGLLTSFESVQQHPPHSFRILSGFFFQDSFRIFFLQDFVFRILSGFFQDSFRMI